MSKFNKVAEPVLQSIVGFLGLPSRIQFLKTSSFAASILAKVRSNDPILNIPEHAKATCTDDQVSALIKRFCPLQLDASGCSLLTDAAFSSLAGKQMRWLELRGCIGVNGGFLPVLGRNHLRYLGLSGTSVTDGAVGMGLRGLSKLTVLDLSTCVGLTGACVFAGVAFLPALEDLDIEGSPGITFGDLSKCRRVRESLVALRNPNAQTLETLEDTWPKLRLLDITECQDKKGANNLVDGLTNTRFPAIEALALSSSGITMSALSRILDGDDPLQNLNGLDISTNGLNVGEVRRLVDSYAVEFETLRAVSIVQECGTSCNVEQIGCELGYGWEHNWNPGTAAWWMEDEDEECEDDSE